jgi:hypothetical protein
MKPKTFNAEAQRTQRVAGKNFKINSAPLRVLCASAFFSDIRVHPDPSAVKK